MTLKEQYAYEVKLLKGRVQKLTNRGYIYEFNITPHKSIKPETIRYIHSLRGSKLTEGISSPNVQLKVVKAEKGYAPTRAEQKEAGISLSEYKQMLESGVNPYELQGITQTRIEFANVMEDISAPEPTTIPPKVDTFDYSSIAPLSYDLSEEEPTLDNAPKAEDLEKGVYYEDIWTGQKFSPEDDRLYMHDNQGRLILDNEGNKILKSTIVLKTNRTMGRAEYEDVLWNSVVERFSIFARSTNAQEFVDWLNQKRDEYGTFKVIEALRKYEEDNGRLTYEFFYKANDADMAALRNAMYKVLMQYERKELSNQEKQDIVDEMDDLERQEWWEEPD